ncbi:hypothetical protein AURDEDRAFT_167932 [Auricularia subglabra TFB-10046 SS5]|nr:hypothetical protein AURDEDRAFT_167932 [Auricularia subglabra TFB-10046 SS5]
MPQNQESQDGTTAWDVLLAAGQALSAAETLLNIQADPRPAKPAGSIRCEVDEAQCRIVLIIRGPAYVAPCPSTGKRVREDDGTANDEAAAKKPCRASSRLAKKPTVNYKD